MASTVHRHDGPPSLLPLLSSFSTLTAGTEFGSYKDPQWQFLLSGYDITGFVAQRDVKEKSFGGCVLRVNLDNVTTGFGMVLVDPPQRGMGIASLLLKTAFEGEKEGVRYVLAVCSLLGQPVYRKLGFKNAGMISMMTCLVSTIWEMELPKNDVNCTAYDGKELNVDQRNCLFRLDQKATGFNREGRMKLLLDGYSEGSCSTVAFICADEENIGYDADAVAVARQDCVGGPLVIGPIMGPDEYLLPLIHALVRKHFDSIDSASDISTTIMISNHPNVVLRLLDIDGMKRLWECPAMSSDGDPVYRNGDGSYLAMMHPTLG